MKRYITLVFSILCAYAAQAQTGTIKGTIKDAKTGEAIIGASAVVTGTVIGGTTDVEGNFTIPKVAAGTYNLTISYISYKNKEIKGVIVEAGKSTVINTSIEENVSELTEVVVRGTRVTETEVAVITEIKQAEQIAVGVSSQQITKTQDRDASQVVQRVPGVSVFDDRFIIIRGLSDRYNTVMLNDVLTPSTEVDVKAFSFDLIPSGIIDRIMIYKSGSADLPGDFAGGMIKIYTKNIPDRNYFNIGVSTSYRAGTTFKDFSNQVKGGTDWLGIDDNTRSLPKGFPAFDGNSTDRYDVNTSRTLPNNWGTTTSAALPDLRINLGLGQKFNLGNTQISNITSVNYSNTNLNFSTDRYRYQESLQDSSFRYKDNQYINNVRIGAISNFSFKFTPTFKLDFRNLFSQLAERETVLREGVNQDSDIEVRNRAYRYESRTIYTGQLAGTFDLSDYSKVTLTAGYSTTSRQQPDFRRVTSSRDRGAAEAPFFVAINTSPSLTDAGRFYSNLHENAYTLSGAWEYKLGRNGQDEKEGDDKVAKLRAGFYAERKQRDFKARFLSYARASSQFNPNLVFQPVDQIFATENISSTGFILQEGTRLSDSYDASNLLVAPYIGLSYPLSSKLFTSVGLRGEYNRQQLNGQKFSGEPVKVDNPILSLLPSLNLSYNFNPKMLMRFAYAYTLNRPEFRELAPFSFYDFNLDVEVTGNDTLKIARIHNFDLRWELYPTPSEQITFGVFYKHFSNPIEQYIQIGSSNITFITGNAISAQNFGAEVEVRKSFQGLSESKFIQNLTLLLNASVIDSKVKLIDTGAQEPNRALFGQSPYLINAGLYYNDEDHRLQVSMLYNVFGKRIFTVGNFRNPTQYEMPRNSLDLTFTKGFGDRFEIRGGVQNILNPRFRLVEDSNRDSKITNADGDIQVNRRGAYTTLGAIFKF